MEFPKVINLPITEICDSQCMMCNVWHNGKTDEFNRESIRFTFKQKPFHKVKHIGLSGGEPTLNNNLLEIIDELLNCLTKLKSLSITSHGYHTEKHSLLLPKIKELCNARGIKFSLNISLDGFEKAHEQVRRIAGAFKKATATANLARKLGIKVQFQCTISPQNVFHVVLLREYAIDNGFDIIFRIASYIARLSNENLQDRIALNDQQKSFISDFIISDKTLFATASMSRRLFYFDLANRLNLGSIRTAPCVFQDKGLFVSPDTKIYNCSRSQEELKFSDKKNLHPDFHSKKNKEITYHLIKNICSDCYHDQNGRWPYWKYFTVHEKFYSQIIFAKKLCHIFTITSKLFYKPSLTKISTHRYQKILIIGMYGGEHVGDAAILGGVVLRSYLSYNCKQYDVVSIRPNRTKHWISNLNLQNMVINAISKKDIDYLQYNAVILGGGPLMGIPTILSNHISILQRIRKFKIPFFIEGIGIGPINDPISQILIRKILKSANRLSVRTESDFRKIERFTPIAKISDDPAFDYLRYIKNKTAIPQSSLWPILNTAKDVWVINLRPLWSRYSNNNEGMQENCLNVISKVLAENKKGKVFVFMPMNSDQFGFSDLEIAYKLLKKVRKLAADADLTIWETEPNIDSCIALLKKASLTISMRFHGCIFSLETGCKTIGLDYSTRSQGKISNLFEQRGIAEYAINIKSISKSKLSKAIECLKTK